MICFAFAAEPRAPRFTSEARCLRFLILEHRNPGRVGRLARTDPPSLLVRPIPPISLTGLRSTAGCGKPREANQGFFLASRCSSGLSDMRLIIRWLLVLSAVMFNANPARVEAANCSAIRDSAECAAKPGCHFDVDKPGCYEGPLPSGDVCAVHVDKVVCSTDTSLNCTWNAEKKKCVTKPD